MHSGGTQVKNPTMSMLNVHAQMYAQIFVKIPLAALIILSNTLLKCGAYGGLNCQSIPLLEVSL